MFDLILNFFVKLLEESGIKLKEVLVFSGLENIYKLEKLFTFYTIDYNRIYLGVAGFSLGLVLVLYLKKGFEIYVLGIEGDSMLDPMVQVISLAKIIFIIVAFNTLFDVAIEIMVKLTSILFSNPMTDLGNILPLTNNMTPNILGVILDTIALITVLRLVFSFVKRSIELFILRIGVPLASLGILNSNHGIWDMYIKKVIQELITISLQAFLLFLSVKILHTGLLATITGLVVMGTALKLPQFLSELLVMPAQANGFGKVHSGLMMASYIRGLLRK